MLPEGSRGKAMLRPPPWRCERALPAAVLEVFEGGGTSGKYGEEKPEVVFGASPLPAR
jgi:hypothetical protein